MKPIYVAATGQHVGKTTTTLGILAGLRERGIRAGYCKPVGQQHVEVSGIIADKDAVLFADSVGFEINPDWHSPVVIGQGVTRAFIDKPDNFHFRERIQAAQRHLSSNYDVVVYEGTGHPGVGSIADLSNAQVAHMLGAGVVMVVEAGIGNTIDKLSLCLSLFREQKVPLWGVIINKVYADKMEEVSYYLRKRLHEMNIPLLGMIPYDRSLSFPIMEAIRQAVEGRVILNRDKMGNRVAEIIAGSLVDIDEFNSFENTLLVVSSKRLDEALHKVSAISKIKKLEQSPLSGVIVTGDGRHADWVEDFNFNHPYFEEYKVPVLATALDTYGSVVKISRIEVKINTSTPWKVSRAIELIHEHVNFDELLRKMEV